MIWGRMSIDGEYVTKPVNPHEVTTLWLHDTNTNKHWNLLTIIEEVQPGQSRAPALQNIDSKGKAHPLKQAKLKTGKLLVNACRFELADEVTAERFFYASAGERAIEVGSDTLIAHPLGPEHQYPAVGAISVPPPQSVCLGDVTTPLQRVLPHRNVTTQATTKLIPNVSHDSPADLRSHFPVISQYAKEWLGIDLENAHELLGATVWSRPNPFFRSFRWSIGGNGRMLVIEGYPRPRIKIPEMQVTIWGEGPLGTESYIHALWHGGPVCFPIGHSRGSILVQVHARNGQLIEERRGSFIHSLHMRTSVGSGARVVNSRQADGSHCVHHVERHSSGGESVIGETDSVTEYLIHQNQLRERRALQRRSDFHYVSSFEPDSAQWAQDFVRSLFSKVRHRCIVADPYLGADELESFVAFVGSLDAEIHVLTSHAHLRPKEKDKRSEGLALAERVKLLEQADPAFKPRITVLDGRDAPSLHDRFLVIDDHVYHIGGSLNHLGHRAMAISRVPAPGQIVADIERWLSGEQSQSFEQWLRHNG